MLALFLDIDKVWKKAALLPSVQSNVIYPEDGGNRFLQNVVTYLPSYTA
jgi:hypothetical protein